MREFYLAKGCEKNRNGFVEIMNLREKTIKGLGWSVGVRFFRQASQFIITAILARLLSPDDFGLLGMASVFTGFAMIFGEMGISGALIQKQDTTEEHLSSAFWLNMVCGTTITILFIIFAPLIAFFYNRPLLTPLLRIMSLAFTLGAFSVVQRALLQKEMKFKALSVAEGVGVLISGLIAIMLAVNGFGVWSLITQLLLTTLISSIILWVFSEWRPRFICTKKGISDIFHFSANMMGFNVLNYISRNIDYLLIGKVLGAEALGYYTLAYKLMIYPLQYISWTIGQVMFPVFSKIQFDLKRVAKNYMRLIKAISFVAFPLMAGLFVVAQEFVLFIYGNKWLPVVRLLHILCVCGAVQSVGTTVGNIFMSQGRADLQFRMQIYGTCLVCFAVVSGLKWGIYGVAFFYTAQTILWSHYCLFVATRMIKLPFSEFYKNLVPSAFFSLIMVGGVLVVKRSLIFSLPVNLFIMFIVGLAIYIILMVMSCEYKRVLR